MVDTSYEAVVFGVDDEVRVVEGVRGEVEVYVCGDEVGVEGFAGEGEGEGFADGGVGSVGADEVCC